MPTVQLSQRLKTELISKLEKMSKCSDMNDDIFHMRDFENLRKYY